MSALDMEFVTSASSFETLPKTVSEVAIVGRSNVGKSSLINAVARRKGMARVSNTPGRTRLLNLFSVGSTARTSEGALPAAIMDLPGYGYARASKSMRGDWQEMIEDYIAERDSLKMIVSLVDGKVGPTTLDVQMLSWLRAYNMPHTVVATKHDKVKSSEREKRKRDLAEKCDLEMGDVIWVSAIKGTGIDRLTGLINTWLA